jgi:hypothetical protein
MLTQKSLAAPLFLSATVLFGAEIFFLNFAGLEQEFAALAHFNAAESGFMDLVLLWGLLKEAARANIQDLAALLETAGKTAENRLKTFSLFAFDFDC